MNTLKRLICVGLVLFPLLSVSAQEAEPGFTLKKNGNLYYEGQLVTNVELQANSDIIRLRHLEYYGDLILEYHALAGHYPFQDKSSGDLYVYVANSRQIGYALDYDAHIPYDHSVVSFKEFVEELERVLCREIDEYYDPQYAPDMKPNWYIYALIDGHFLFAVHVHQKFTFSKKIAPYFYKVEISDRAVEGAMPIFLADDLLASADFLTEKEKPVAREGYFLEREELFRHETKK